MKAPIIIERLFKNFKKDSVNLEWLKYTVLVIAVVITMGGLIFTIVRSVQEEDYQKDAQCAVAYGDTKWEHERHDTNPNDKNAPVIDRCFNVDKPEEVKDFPKEEK